MVTMSVISKRQTTREDLLREAEADGGTLKWELADRSKRHEKRRIRKLAREMHELRREYMLETNTAVREYVDYLRSLNDKDLIECNVEDMERQFGKCLKRCRYFDSDDFRNFLGDVRRERFIVVAEISKRSGRAETTVRSMIRQANLRPVASYRGTSVQERWLLAPGECTVRRWTEHFYERSVVADLFSF